jgi:hypothetical protein
VVPRPFAQCKALVAFFGCGYTSRIDEFSWHTRARSSPNQSALKFVYCPNCGFSLPAGELVRRRSNCRLRI